MADAAKGRERLEAARRSKLAQQAPLVCDDEPQRNYTQVHNNVSRCAILSDGAFRTYFNIKSHYWGRGSCFPGLDLLASYQGVSERTIRSNIAELKTAGLLDVHQRGLGLTNEYVIPSAQHWTPEALEAARASSRQQSGNVLPLRENANGPEADFRSRPEADFRSGPEADFRLRRHSKKKTQKEEDTGCSASGDAPPASAPKNGAKTRERACKTAEEEAERERLMRAFNDLLRPIDFTELGRCRNEMLRGLREHEYEGMEGCMRAMSTSKRFVGQSWVTPVTVVRNVLTWEDAGRPRQWGRVEEYAAHKARQQGGAGR